VTIFAPLWRVQEPPEIKGIIGLITTGQRVKKMLASKIKTTYFVCANNSTPFFALVMPSGLTRSIVLLNRSFKRTSPVYD